MYEMHANETNGQSPPHPANDQHIQTGHGTRGRPANGYRPVSRTIKRIHGDSHRHGHTFTLPIYILRHQSRCKNNRKGASRHHDTTSVPTYDDLNRQKTQFMSEVVADATRVLGIQLRHATTNHAQTIGIIERCHASLKEALKI